MDVSATKLKLIEWILQLKDNHVLEKLETIAEFKNDWWDEISEAEKQGIMHGLEDVKEGRVYSHSSVKKEIENLSD